MTIKQPILDMIKTNKELKNKLIYKLNISSATLQRWLKDNSDNLTKYEALEIIASELNYKVSDLVQLAETE